MAQSTTLTTGRASLCALGEYLRRRCFLAPFHEQVNMAQKAVKYCPTEKRLDGLLGMLCGAKTIAQSNVTIKVDPAVQRAFGRKSCADQSTIARTLHACAAENVAQLERVSQYYLKRYGVTPRHPFHQERSWVDADLTPMPIGPKAAGSERAWMGRHRSITGRKTLRITASAYRDILHETLLRGKAAAVPALKAALVELEAKWGWTREIRQRIVIRLDGGFGTTGVLNGILSRGYQVVAKISQQGRVRKLRQQVGPWQPTSTEGREIAAVLSPRRFCRNTRQYVIRTPKKQGGDQYAVLVTTWRDLPPAEVADQYDGRAMLEATFCQDKPGLGLVKRCQHKWEAQQMVLLLARLAHHLLLWSKRWLSRVPATRWRLRGYRVVRLLQEVGTVSGIIRWRRGWRVTICFLPLHPLAKPLQQSFAALFHGRVLVRCVRQKLAAARESRGTRESRASVHRDVGLAREQPARCGLPRSKPACQDGP
jgi:Transposase DDE domain group 1